MIDLVQYIDPCRPVKPKSTDRQLKHVCLNQDQIALKTPHSLLLEIDLIKVRATSYSI